MSGEGEQKGHDLVLYPAFSQLWGLMFTARTMLPKKYAQGILRALWVLLCSQKRAEPRKGRLCTSLWRYGASQLLWIRALGSSLPLIYCTGLVCLAQHRRSAASWLRKPCYFPFMLPLAEATLQRGRTNYLFLYWRGTGGKSGGKQLLLPRWQVKILFPGQEYKPCSQPQDGMGCLLLWHAALQDVPCSDNQGTLIGLADWLQANQALLEC